MEQRINEILTNISEQGLFSGIKRVRYMPYSLEMSLKVVEAIGKSRNPKFVIDDDNRWTYEQLIKWVHADPSMQAIDPQSDRKRPIPIEGRLDKGLYVAGRTGSGKSWAMEIMAAYCLVDYPKFYIGGKTHSLVWRPVRTDTVCEDYAQSGNMRQYKDRTVLCLQDLGSEPSETLYMGNRIEVIRQIIEYRGDQSDKITLITSNFPISGKQIEDKYGARVQSRLSEMCNYLIIDGKDRRL